MHIFNPRDTREGAQPCCPPPPAPIGSNAWTWNSSRFIASVFWTESALGLFYSHAESRPCTQSPIPGPRPCPR